jgi:conjugative relaxase-like TrwC/TraI family protein
LSSWGANEFGPAEVLSISKMRLGAERYYLGVVASGIDEYYSGEGESPGVWLGSGCGDLGLSGEVRPEELSELFAGRSPTDGSELLRTRVPAEVRVAGFDLTFSAPKSVSVLYGLGSDEVSAEVRHAHHVAVADATRYLEAHAVVARRGAGGAVELSTSGLMAAAFTHRTSRAGDPQLHTHLLAMNVTRASDGQFSSLHAARIYQHLRTAGYLYQAALRAGLTERLGVRFGPVTKGAAELDGIPAGLLKEFSTRRQQILSRLDELEGTSRRTREIATLETRPVKEHVADAEGLRERWWARCLEVGFELPAPRLLGPRSPFLDEAGWKELRRELFGWQGLTREVSVFERRDVVRAVAERLSAGGRLDLVETGVEWLLSDTEVVALGRVGRGGEALYTTEGLLEVERRLLGAAETLRGKGAKVPEEVVEAVIFERPAMADEQKEMVRRLTRSGDGLQVVVGKAGAGKTFALDATRAAFQRAGYLVQGTALSARAAAELEAGAGISSCTLARFMSPDNLMRLDRRSVVVVDEAGVIGTRDLQQLVFHAGRADASVILVGDHRQLPEIEAGGTLAGLERRVGAVHLEENRRQREPWERAALDQLRSGEVAEAIVAYDEQGRIHLHDSAPTTRAAMVRDWAAARTDNAEVRMYALSRADVGALNDLAREELRRRGLLGEDVLEAAGRGYACGDEVLFLRNERRMGVLNGTRGTVLRTEGEVLLVETDKDVVRVDPDYLEAGFVGHGYASTVHKAQGATVDRAFVLGGEQMYREAGYVAMSRARERTDLYVVASAFDEGLVPSKDLRPLLTRAFSASRAKQLATDALSPERAARLEAERAQLAAVLVGTPRDPGPARFGLENERCRRAERSWPADPHEPERFAKREQHVLELQEAARRFESSHGSELERAGEIDAAVRVRDQLLGEAALQRPEPHLLARLGAVPELPSERSRWARAAGVVQSYLARLTGLGRSPEISPEDTLRREDTVERLLEREGFGLARRGRGRDGPG